MSESKEILVCHYAPCHNYVDPTSGSAASNGCIFYDDVTKCSHYRKQSEAQKEDVLFCSCIGCKAHETHQKLGGIVDLPSGCMIHEDVTECATFRQLYQPQKYSNRVLRAVRQQLGYDEDNVAADTEINAMSRHEVFDRWLRWEGIIGYHVRLISVIEDIYKVKLEPSDD